MGTRKIIQQAIIEENTCDACGADITDTNAQYIFEREGAVTKRAYTFHTKCLVEHLRKTFVPEYEQGKSA